MSAGNPQSLNRHAHVGNNPLNQTDPSEHCRPDECDPGENYFPYDDGNGNNDGGDPAIAGIIANAEAAVQSPQYRALAVMLTLDCLSGGASLDCIQNNCNNAFFCSGNGIGTPPVGGVVPIPTPFDLTRHDDWR